MFYEPYTAEDLHVAYCHRIFLHAQTHRRLPQAALEKLRRQEFQATLDPYDIHLLDVGTDDTDLICQLSLKPDEAVATAAGKFKGRLSKWLRGAMGLAGPRKLLATGYLAYTQFHVHLAVRLHPAVRPLTLAVDLMNQAQTVMFEQFPEIMIRYGSDRLWENGAYVGSFGKVDSRAVRQVIGCWRRASRGGWPGWKPNWSADIDQ